MRFLLTLCILLTANVRAADTDVRALVSQWITAGAKARSLEIDFIQERKLKALRKPLTKPGKIWFQRPDSFRWQIAEPPAIVAVRKSGGDLMVADTQKKKLTIHTQAELEADLAKGGGHGFSMMTASMPDTMVAFEKVFEIDAINETAEKGVWELHLDLRDRKARIAVYKIIFLIVPADGSLRQFEIQMRDGSVTTTRITRAVKNQPIPAGTFSIDTTGYTIVKP